MSRQIGACVTTVNEGCACYDQDKRHYLPPALKFEVWPGQGTCHVLALPLPRSSEAPGNRERSDSTVRLPIGRRVDGAPGGTRPSYYIDTVSDFCGKHPGIDILSIQIRIVRAERGALSRVTRSLPCPLGSALSHLLPSRLPHPDGCGYGSLGILPPARTETRP